MNTTIPADFFACGSSGTLCAVHDEVANCQWVCKYFSDDDLQYSIEKEILETIKGHPRVITIIEARPYLQIDHQKKHILLEYASKGSLSRYFGNGTMHNEDLVNHVLRQLCEGVDYLHNVKGIAHRDLKPHNAVFDDNTEVKIIDFGHATPIKRDEDNNELLSYTKAGTECYSAPEVYAGEAYYPTKADIFALGVCFFEIITGHRPFTKPTDDDANFALITNGRFDELWNNFQQPAWLTEEIKNLINTMIDFFPDFRPTIQEILQHKWFSPSLQKCSSIFDEAFDFLEEGERITYPESHQHQNLTSNSHAKGTPKFDALDSTGVNPQMESFNHTNQSLWGSSHFSLLNSPAPKKLQGRKKSIQKDKRQGVYHRIGVKKIPSKLQKFSGDCNMLTGAC